MFPIIVVSEGANGTSFHACLRSKNLRFTEDFSVFVETYRGTAVEAGPPAKRKRPHFRGALSSRSRLRASNYYFFLAAFLAGAFFAAFLVAFFIEPFSLTSNLRS